jgi:hypothetical protein
MDMIFYRFDRSGGDDLWFRFGDQFDYRGGVGHQLYARAGEDFCFDLSLSARAEIEPGFTIDFYLTQGYDTLRTAVTLPLGAHTAGEPIDLAPCIPVPPDTPPGPHHLRTRIAQPAPGGSLPLLEHGDIYWGDVLIFALVSVE